MSKIDPFAVALTPELLLRAYRHGIFPMAESAAHTEVMWIDPDLRGILPLDQFRVSRSLKKTLRRGEYTVRVDYDFDRVISACAQERKDSSGTWINAGVQKAYGELFELGWCHTVEVWAGGGPEFSTRPAELVAGLYGLSIGGAFFGESMFHTKRDMSKVALAYLVSILKKSGHTLLDTQFLTPHLESLGGVEITRIEYHNLLRAALQREVTPYWVAGGAISDDCLQLLNQIS